MIEFLVKINSINDVKDFANLASKCQGSVDVMSGRYVVDGRSIMGMYSLNLSEPVKVCIDGEISAEVNEQLSRFVVKQEG